MVVTSRFAKTPITVDFEGYGKEYKKSDGRV